MNYALTCSAVSVNSISYFCLIISVKSNILKWSFHKFGANEDAPFLKSLNTQPSRIGWSWYKSPNAMILTLPNRCFVPVSSWSLWSIKLSKVLPTIDISSIITTDKLLYFDLNVFKVSQVGVWFDCLNFDEMQMRLLIHQYWKQPFQYMHKAELLYHLGFLLLWDLTVYIMSDKKHELQHFYQHQLRHLKMHTEEHPLF